MKKIISIISLFMFPMITFAAPVTSFDNLFIEIKRLLGLILPVIISIAVVWFIYNVFNYAILSGDEEAKAKAKTNMIWGIVALFVMVSVWGLVNFLKSSTNFDLTPPETSNLILKI